MRRQFQREHHNRQDKVWKEPTGCVGGEESPGLWISFVTHDNQIGGVLNREVANQMRRQGLMEAFVTEVQRWRFIVLGHKFMFSWNVKAFAKANGMSLSRAKLTFEKVRTDAVERLRIVKQRIRRNGFRIDYELDAEGNTVEVHSLSYQDLSKFLPRDDGEQAPVD